jgi:hypothetical protein
LRQRITIGVLLIAFAFLQLESFKILELGWPAVAYREYYPFIDPDYSFPAGYKLTAVWWWKLCSIDLKNLILMPVVAWLFWPFSRKLGSVFVSYSLYYITDHFMLWYNYRSSEWVYLVENACIILSIILLFVVRERRGKVKSLI